MIPRWALALSALAAGCEYGCGASNAEVQVAEYTAEEQVCALHSPSYDSGLECLIIVRATRCGPGGTWLDAGLCPEAGK